MNVVVNMDAVVQRLEYIEQILGQIATRVEKIDEKIENFMGYEVLSSEEKKEIERLRKEIRENPVAFEQVFS